MDITLENGLVIEKAYLRISNFNGNKQTLNLTIDVYLDYETFLGGKPSIYSFLKAFTPDVSKGTADFYVIGYDFLKKEPEFIDAVDVFEEGQPFV